jgi:hypothetical protein
MCSPEKKRKSNTPTKGTRKRTADSGREKFQETKMGRQLIIKVQVDRLPDITVDASVDGATGGKTKAQLGVRLSAAIRADTGDPTVLDDRDLLLPWKWRAKQGDPDGTWDPHDQKNWTLWHFTENVPTLELVKDDAWEMAITFPKDFDKVPTGSGQTVGPFNQRIEDEIKRIVADGGIHALEEPSDEVIIGRKVFGLVESLTSLPSPVPAGMKVWTAISIDTTKFPIGDNERFVAIPKFVTPGAASEYWVDNSILRTVTLADEEKALEFTYEKSKPLSLDSKCEVYPSLTMASISISKTPTQQLIDLSTLLVRCGDGSGFETSDWSSTLSLRIAEAVDLAARAMAVLDQVIRQEVNNDTTNTLREAIRTDILSDGKHAPPDFLRLALSALHMQVLAPRVRSSRPTAAPAAALLERLATSNPSLWPSVVPLLFAHAGAEDENQIPEAPAHWVVSRARLASAAGIVPGRNSELADESAKTGPVNTIDNEQDFRDWILTHWTTASKSASAQPKKTYLFQGTEQQFNLKSATREVTLKITHTGVLDLMRVQTDKAIEIVIPVRLEIIDKSKPPKIFTFTLGISDGASLKFEMTLDSGKIKLLGPEATETEVVGTFSGGLLSITFKIPPKDKAGKLTLDLNFQDASGPQLGLSLVDKIDELARKGRLGLKVDASEDILVWIDCNPISLDVMQRASVGPEQGQALRRALSLAHAGPAIAGLMAGWVPMVEEKTDEGAKAKELRQRLIETIKNYVDKDFKAAFEQAAKKAASAIDERLSNAKNNFKNASEADKPDAQKEIDQLNKANAERSKLTSLFDLLCKAASENANLLANELIPDSQPTPPEADVDVITQDAPPLCFLVDQLQDFDGHVDLWARLAGLGVLIGRSSEGEKPDNWWSLNVATLHVTELSKRAPLSETGDDKKSVAEKSAVPVGAVGNWWTAALVDPVPLVVGEISGVRNAMIRYDSQSIVAEMEGRPQLDQRGPASNAARRPEVYFFPVNKTGFPKLPPLTFGRAYHIVPYLIGHGGVVPPIFRSQISDPTGFINTRNDKGAITIPADKIVGVNKSKVVRSKHYRRTVPVGAPRLSPQSKWPVLQENGDVAPLAAELPVRPAPITLRQGVKARFFLDKEQTRGTLNSPPDTEGRVTGISIVVESIDIGTKSGKLTLSATTKKSKEEVLFTVTLELKNSAEAMTVGVGLRIDVIGKDPKVWILKSRAHEFAEDEPEAIRLDAFIVPPQVNQPVSAWLSFWLTMEVEGDDFDVEPPSVRWGAADSPPGFDPTLESPSLELYGERLLLPSDVSPPVREWNIPTTKRLLSQNQENSFFLQEGQTQGMLDSLPNLADRTSGLRIEVGSVDVDKTSTGKLILSAKSMLGGAVSDRLVLEIDRKKLFDVVGSSANVRNAGFRIEIIGTAINVWPLVSRALLVDTSSSEPKKLDLITKPVISSPVAEWKSFWLVLKTEGEDFKVEPPSIQFGRARATLALEGGRPIFPPELVPGKRNLALLDGIRVGRPQWPTSATLFLRRPATTLATYDRWINGPISGDYGSADKEIIKKALNNAHNWVTNKPEAGQDRSLEDPAVEALAIEVVRLFPQRNVDQHLAVLHSIPNRNTDLKAILGWPDEKKINGKDFPGLEIIIDKTRSPLDGVAKLKDNNSKLELVSGCVYELRVYGAIPKNQDLLAPVAVKNRFANAAVVAWRDSQIDGANWHLGEPLILTVEVATEIMPEIYLSEPGFVPQPFTMTLMRPPTVMRESARVHLTPDVVSLKDIPSYKIEVDKLPDAEKIRLRYSALRYVDRMALLEQRWSWRGRPHPEISLGQGTEPDNQSTNEGGAFGEHGRIDDGARKFVDAAFIGRADDDIGPIHEMRITRSHAYGGGAVFDAPKPEKPPVLIERQLDYRGGANLWRFALRAKSRYAGLRPNDPSLLRFSHLRSGSPHTLWWPFIVPDRANPGAKVGADNRKPMRPGLMLVLPLTEPLMASGSVPPLLALFNEAMFPLFHAGDGIEAVIEVARHPFIGSKRIDQSKLKELEKNWENVNKARKEVAEAEKKLAELLTIEADSSSSDIDKASEELKKANHNLDIAMISYKSFLGFDFGSDAVASGSPFIKYWPEVAPDPIRTGEGASGEPLALRCDGPVGYTFDVETEGGRFDHAGILISPVGEKVRPWSMVKLRFRRLEAPELLVNSLVSPIKQEGSPENCKEEEIRLSSLETIPIDFPETLYEGLALDVNNLKSGSPVRLQVSFDDAGGDIGFVDVKAQITDSNFAPSSLSINASTQFGEAGEWSTTFDQGSRVELRLVVSQRPKPGGDSKYRPAGDVSVRVRIIRETPADMLQRPNENAWLSVICMPLTATTTTSTNSVPLLHIRCPKDTDPVKFTARRIRLSDFTPGVWCQFAAAMSRVVVHAELGTDSRKILEALPVSQLTAKKDAEGKALELGIVDSRTGKNLPVKTIAFTADGAPEDDAQVEERLYAIATLFVYDAFDRIRERPIAIYRLPQNQSEPILRQKNLTWPESPPVAPYANGHGRIRILRILCGKEKAQGNNGFVSESQEFPKNFFGFGNDETTDENPVDAAGQVIGISMPFDWT